MPTATNDLRDEVFFRINQRLTQAQVVPYLNRALNIISAAASYDWDTITNIYVAQPGGALTPVPVMDIGKKIAAWNNASGTPIVRIAQCDYGSAGMGYVDGVLAGAVPVEFEAFRVGANTVSPYLPLIDLIPSTVTADVKLQYHALPPVLVSGGQTVRWNNLWMDDLLIDFAEAEIKRILNLSGWEALEGRCKAKLAEARRIYSTERENTGPPEEAAEAVQEKNTMGRG